MCIMGCWYLVVLWCWRIFGRNDRQWSREAWRRLTRAAPGPYVTTKLYIPTHTHTIQLGSLIRMGRLILPSKPPKPGYLAQVVGTCTNFTSISFWDFSCNRMCPGRHFAIRMLCFTIASILATFDILPPINDNGCPKIPEPKYHNTFIRWAHSVWGETGQWLTLGDCPQRHAMPFECVVKPRSEKATKLIHNAVLVH